MIYLLNSGEIKELAKLPATIERFNQPEHLGVFPYTYALLLYLAKERHFKEIPAEKALAFCDNVIRRIDFTVTLDSMEKAIEATLKGGHNK